MDLHPVKSNLTLSTNTVPKLPIMLIIPKTSPPELNIVT